MKKKQEFKCGKCYRTFTTRKGLSIHDTRSHPWVPPPAPPAPETSHVNFRDLVKNSFHSWGSEMTARQKKSPTMDQLQLGALLEIIHRLDEIARHFVVRK